MEQETGMQMKVIAHIRNDFPEKFGIPHQSGRIEALKATVAFEPEYQKEEAFRGLSEFSHIWLLWQFSEAVREGWSPTVRPPRLGGNVRKGVFATRSPFRPNPIGLSCVRLERVEFSRERGPVLHISGADLMDGTPIYDIKPYLPQADCRPGALGGFADRIEKEPLQVEFPRELLERIPEKKRKAALAVLADDPRPGYQSDPERVYGMAFGSVNIRFTVDGQRLTVFAVEKMGESGRKR